VGELIGAYDEDPLRPFDRARGGFGYLPTAEFVAVAQEALSIDIIEGLKLDVVLHRGRDPMRS